VKAVGCCDLAFIWDVFWHATARFHYVVHFVHSTAQRQTKALQEKTTPQAICDRYHELCAFLFAASGRQPSIRRSSRKTSSQRSARRLHSHVTHLPLLLPLSLLSLSIMFPKASFPSHSLLNLLRCWVSLFRLQ